MACAHAHRPRVARGKEHFGSAYDVWLTSGAGTGSSQGYHGANMGYDDDDIINTIGEKLTEQARSTT